MTLGDGAARAHYLRYSQWLTEQPAERLAQKRAEADALFHRVGITFAVYGQDEGSERLIPFDIVPRVLPLEEWIRLEGGLKQRVRALNAFIHDIYHDQQILKAGVIPAEQVLCNSQYRPEMQGVDVPAGAHNSAYFEHAFLAQQMGIELVEGQDLFVRDEAVFMRTTQGPQRVDVIYRRIDDDFLD